MSLVETHDTLIITTAPTTIDWLIAVGTTFLGTLTAVAATKSIVYSIGCFIVFAGLSISLIDDSYQLKIDRKKGQVSVTKTNFGRIKSIRKAPLEELFQVKKIKTFN